LNFAGKSDVAGFFVNAVCSSETVGIGRNPGSFGEKENTGIIVKWMKTRMRNRMKSVREM
jgi:hypothetical protein